MAKKLEIVEEKKCSKIEKLNLVLNSEELNKVVEKINEIIEKTNICQ
jgi:hypothetical protein